MPSVGEQIRQLRARDSLPLRKVAAELDIDQSILSKIERGERRATKQQIIKVAKMFNVDEKPLIIDYLSEKILYELRGEDFAVDALKVAEEKIIYLTKEINGK